MLPLAEGAGRVMLRQARALVGGKRFVAAAILVAFAPLLAALVRNPDPVTFTRIVLHLVLGFLLPLLGVAFGSGLLHGEAEEGTLTYLFTAPLSRSAVVLGKWAASLVWGGAMIAASLGLAFLVTPADLSGQPGFAAAVFTAAFLGFAAYLGIFTFFGTLFRHGYIAGLLYAFLFEMVLWFVPGAAKRLSVGFFVQSIVKPRATAKEAFEGYFDSFPPDSLPVCAAVLLGAAVLTVAATLLVVPHREFRAKNVQG
jgi:ABC-type transport system involved in multi-copper enzyme maturation permease subunit